MPVGWTARRRIGSFRTDGSMQIVQFYQDGDCFLYLSPIPDLTDEPVTSTPTLYAVSAPNGVVGAKALVRGKFVPAPGEGSVPALIISPFDNSTATSASNCNTIGDGSTFSQAFDLTVSVDSLNRVKVITGPAGGSLDMTAYGYIDPRDIDV
jgi:hypothetical protein